MKAVLKSSIPEASHQLSEDGFEILNGVLPLADCQILADELTRLHQKQKESSGVKLGGLRNLLRLNSTVAKLASADAVKAIICSRVHVDVFPVRALFFDKTPDANWGVAWHQDLSIAVVDRSETPGFSGWSVKEGVVHVQPPPPILEGMVTLRLHLDDCTAENGALKVIPGSHRQGRLSATAIAVWSQDRLTVTCGR